MDNKVIVSKIKTILEDENSIIYDIVDKESSSLLLDGIQSDWASVSLGKRVFKFENGDTAQKEIAEEREIPEEREIAEEREDLELALFEIDLDDQVSSKRHAPRYYERGNEDIHQDEEERKFGDVIAKHVMIDNDIELARELDNELNQKRHKPSARSYIERGHDDIYQENWEEE